MSTWTDIRDKLLGVAPTLAGALGTAAGGPILGAAAGALSSALLGRKDGTPGEIAAHLATLSPEKLLELRVADNTFKLEMERLGYRPDELTVEDRKDARAMQVAALNQSDPFAKRFIYYFATGWSIITALYIAFITFGTIPTANVRFADTVLGFLLGTIVSTIIQYFFGTSFGAHKKDELITRIAGK